VELSPTKTASHRDASFKYKYDGPVQSKVACSCHIEHAVSAEAPVKSVAKNLGDVVVVWLIQDFCTFVEIIVV